MNKKIVSFAMTSVMAFALAVSAAAEGGEPSIEVGGVVSNTTSDYTVVIPTGDFTHLNLGNVGVTGERVPNLLGDVKVVRNDDTLPFDSTKRIVINTASDHGNHTVNGALYNEDADKYLKYELSKSYPNGDGSLIYKPVFNFAMFFSADDINHGNPQSLYLAVVDPTDKVPNGTYTDTLTFHVTLENVNPKNA